MMRTEIRHTGQILSATVDAFGEVAVFDLPDSHAGRPGTITAAESARWVEADWRRLASQRAHRMRRAQRKAGLRGPRARITATYARETLRQQAAMHPQWTLEQIDPDTIDICYGGSMVESWRREEAPIGGGMWARYLPGHALPDRVPARDADPVSGHHDAAEWRRRRDLGESFRAIAAAFGVSDRTVRSALSGAPTPTIPSGPRKQTTPTVEEVVKVYRATGSIRATAREFRVSPTLVHIRLADAGLMAHPDKRPRKRSALAVPAAPPVP